MDEETMGELEVVMSLLRNVCVQRGLGIAVLKEGGLCFFKSDEYLKTGKLDGKCCYVTNIDRITCGGIKG